jgi:hypothetical protein
MEGVCEVAEQVTTLPVAGWYADPRVPRQLRWWDGDGWTNNVHMPDTGSSTPDLGELSAGLADQNGKWEWPKV